LFGERRPFMRIDRYLQLVLTVVMLALTALAVSAWLPSDWLSLRPVQAQPAEEKPSGNYPLAWGRLVTTVYNANTDTYTWYFEAADGTVRAVNRRTNQALVYQRR
jgi:hypothetical protein